MKNKNIRIVGDDGKESPLENKKKRGGSLAVVAMLFSLFLGLIGGVLGTILVLAAPSNIQSKLGIDKLQQAVDDSVKNEKIVVEEESATIDVVKKVSPAVVSIMFTKDVNVYNPFNYFGTGNGQSTVTQQGGGSGFIITSDGLIVTNKHVVSDTAAKYTVYTNDKKTYDATVVALDPTMDLALMKIEATGLPVVELGASDKLQVGQKVVAIGNALAEFENTVTEGVLSAIGRSITASDGTGQSGETLSGLLQTDAAINSGNSGGPLVNLRGQVIGMNTATAAKGTAEGIGFAIPIDDLKSAIESVKKTGKIVRPLLGVNTIELTKDIATKLNVKTTEGFIIIGDINQGILAVVKDSPADKAGLREKDIITKINDSVLNGDNSLATVLRKFNPGDEITLTIVRDDQEKSIKVKLGERTE